MINREVKDPVYHFFLISFKRVFHPSGRMILFSFVKPLALASLWRIRICHNGTKAQRDHKDYSRVGKKPFRFPKRFHKFNSPTYEPHCTDRSLGRPQRGAGL